MDPEKIECDGIPGILKAYRESFPRLKLSGPTIFSNVIQTVSAMAASEVGNQTYTVLLILTDGVICDMKNTIDCIVNGCALPLSIVIVGVGNADFTAMDTLDGDEGTLKNSQGVNASKSKKYSYAVMCHIFTDVICST